MCCPTDKDTKETTFHIDIKSESLRDILRVILGDVHGISLKEPVLSVRLLCFYSFTALTDCLLG